MSKQIHLECNAEAVPMEAIRLAQSIMHARESTLIERQLAQLALSNMETINKLIIAMETGSITLREVDDVSNR